MHAAWGALLMHAAWGALLMHAAWGALLMHAAWGALVLPACSLVLDADELSLSDAGDGQNDAARELIIEHSGMRSCVFEYAIGPSQCPETCASWSYVVDASASRGIETFLWTFEATHGYRVEPDVAQGPRAHLTIATPQCLIGGTDMRPFSIIARLSIDGAAPTLLDFVIGVAPVGVCDGPGSCEEP